MIYCTTQPLTKYGELYTNYEHDPYVWNLMTRTVSAMFQYEQGFEDFSPTKRHVLINDNNTLKSTLEQDVAGVQVRTLLATMNPVEMWDYFHIHKPDHLDLNFLYQGDPQILQTVMHLRVLQFKQYYRGPLTEVRSNRTQVQAQFRSSLTVKEQEVLDQAKGILKTQYRRK